jgi:hypothetical protein
MATSPPTSSVAATFPFPTLTKFATTFQPPTHATLQVLQRELNANAMSVHSNDGGGLHGHLTLTITPVRYLAVTGAVFPIPGAPPAVPVVPANPAAAVAAAIQAHQEQVRIFQRYHDTDRALLRQIIEATPATYIEALSDIDFGYANVSTLQMLTHLHTTYGKLTPADRDSNLARMHQPWMPPTPIEILFLQLEDGQRFANAAAEPIADTTLSRMGYQLILKTGMFPDGCREWRLKPEVDQTWANFKIHFARQDRDRLETATAESSGYGTAFLVRPGEPPSVPAPTIESALVATTLPSGDELVALLVELRQFRMMHQKQTTPTTPKSTGARGYCWTHGSSANATHTSLTCKNKAPGHIDSATWRNQQGGNPNQYAPRRATPGTGAAPTPA